MNGIIKDIVFYVFFLIVLMMTAYTSQDYRSFLQNDCVKKDVLGARYVRNFSHHIKLFKQVKTYDNFFEYVNYTLIPTMYPEYCYNGEACSMYDGKWIANAQQWRLRHVQLRQLRIKKPGSCTVTSAFRSIIKKCRQDYSQWSEESGDFVSNWEHYNISGNWWLKWNEIKMCMHVNINITSVSGQIEI